MPANPYVAPTQTTAPVANTTAGLWTFAAPASKLLVTNRSGVTVYLRFNSGANAATVAVHDASLADGASENYQAGWLGIGTFSTVSVWFPVTATVASFTVRGI